MYKTVPKEMSLNLKLKQCQSHNDNRGTWSNKLLVLAALYNPGVVGWSGTIDRKMSKWFLNRAKSVTGALTLVTDSEGKVLRPPEK